jgi:MoxR-like ATPase
MAYPSQIERTALRTALRNHPRAQTVLNGQLINNLTRAELDKALITLGLDPLAIIQHVNGAMITATAQPCDLPSQASDETDQLEPIEDDMGETARAIAATLEIDPVEAEVQTIRSLIVTGGFSALDDRLRELVRDARKPAVEIVREIEVEAPGTSGPVVVSKPTGQLGTWRDLFDVRDRELGKRTTALWDGVHPDTPAINDRYLWPQPQTAIALTQLHRGRNIMMFGPAGTGKTEWAQQLAARTGRPFALISCDTGTDAATLVGMTVPAAGGGVTWQDGQLTRAIRTPGCVVCIDEPSVARAGALFVFQNVLQNRALFIAETGQRVKVASGVLFVACDNTNGTGGGARRGYTDTNRLNAAFLDRFGPRIKFSYMKAAAEADVVAGYTGCTRELAALLVSAATVTRAAEEAQTVSHGIGLRRLLSWAELLTDGIGAEEAFQSAVLNCASEQDVEALREQCLLAYDKQAVAQALNPTAPVQADPAIANPTPAGRAAASDFSNAYYR